MGTEQRGITADQVVKAVIDVRRKHHACTPQALRDELGLSMTGTRWWLAKLLDSGVLRQTDVAGSIHVP